MVKGIDNSDFEWILKMEIARAQVGRVLRAMAEQISVEVSEESFAVGERSRDTEGYSSKYRRSVLRRIESYSCL